MEFLSLELRGQAHLSALGAQFGGRRRVVGYTGALPFRLDGDISVSVLYCSDGSVLSLSSTKNYVFISMAVFLKMRLLEPVI